MTEQDLCEAVQRSSGPASGLNISGRLQVRVQGHRVRVSDEELGDGEDPRPETIIGVKQVVSAASNGGRWKLPALCLSPGLQ